jgi:hypothetical protein
MRCGSLTKLDDLILTRSTVRWIVKVQSHAHTNHITGCHIDIKKA